jgi:hypothetical protein
MGGGRETSVGGRRMWRWAQHQFVAVFFDEDLRCAEAESLWQKHGLATSVLEELGGGHG